MTTQVSQFDPGRLAAAVALAAGAVPAHSDQHLCETLLTRLCALLPASHGLLVLGDGDTAVVHAATGGPSGLVGHAVSGRSSALTALLPQALSDTCLVPLAVRDERVGGLELGREHGPAFSADDRALADLVAPRLALLLERHRLQLALTELRALHKAVVDTIVDGVIVIDHRGRIEWTNDVALALFGYDAVELIGENVRSLMPQPDTSQHDGYLSHYLSTGERRVIGIGREVRGKRKDGSEFPLYLAVGETRVDGARKFTGIVRDLTGTKRLEHLVQERQTLARIGELAAVVAHEVRNPLAAIRGVVEVIQTRFATDSPDRAILGDLLVRVDSLDQLVSDLLVYARPAPPVFRPVSVLALARDTAAMVASDRGTDAVRFEVTGDEAELWIDPAQMGRALLNLLTNSAQALRDTGVVHVTGERQGGHYRLTVADAGPGMAPDVAAKCLEPFFTTKTRGTGLGLAIAKRVVDEHGGGFAVQSEPGVGTRVSIDLPVAPMATAAG